MAEYQGSAYTRWNEDVRDKYIRVLDYIISIVKDIPRWEGSGLILDMDVDDLLLACEALKIDIDGVLDDIILGKGTFKYLFKKNAKELLMKFVLKIKKLIAFVKIKISSEDEKEALLDYIYSLYDEELEQEYHSRELLYNMSVFKAIKGHILREMRKIVEEKLKPTDPLLEKISELDNIGDKEKRDIMGENEPDI